jgi:hypothetical protein
MMPLETNKQKSGLVKACRRSPALHFASDYVKANSPLSAQPMKITSGLGCRYAGVEAEVRSTLVKSWLKPMSVELKLQGVLSVPDLGTTRIR